jgi:hypothetical protein
MLGSRWYTNKCWLGIKFLVEIHEWLDQAQQHYKLFYDKKHQELEFEVGQWVWVRLLHRPIASLKTTSRGTGKSIGGDLDVDDEGSEQRQFEPV